MKSRIGLALVAPVLFVAQTVRADEQPIAPQVLFEDLYVDVELQRIFPDSKEFADATPKSPPPDILVLYRAHKPFSPEALKRFVAEHFDLPADPAELPLTSERVPIRRHIDALWERLTRDTPATPPHSSLLPLPQPYVVPGGRFRELYYWDSYFTMLGLAESGRRDSPRDESYREDIAQAQATPRDSRQTYREIRAAAESGWDFSSRWFADSRTLATIDTTEIVPVDLNSLLFGLESALRAGCERAGDHDCAKDYAGRAAARRAAIDRYLWDKSRGVFLDYRWTLKQRIDSVSAATLYPLFTQVASETEAASVAGVAEKELLKAGFCRDHGRHRTAMGRAERMGASSVDRRRRLDPLWAKPARRAGRMPLDGQCLSRLSPDWQVARKIRRDQD